MLSVPEVRIILIVYLVCINLFTYLLFVWDKLCKKYHKPRVPEFLLFLMSLIGGALGGYLALLIKRSKKRKKLFKFGLPVMILLHAAIIFILQMGL